MLNAQRLGLAGLIWMGAVAAAGAQQPLASDASDEFRRCFEGGLNAAHTLDSAQFLAAINQYGPLDLMILRHDIEPGTARQLREYFLGGMSGVAHIDVKLLILLSEKCGQSCFTARRDSLVAALDIARSLADQIRRFRHTSIMAVWPDGWAVDSLVYGSSGYSMRQISPIMGFLPWQWHAVDSTHAIELLRAAGTTTTEVAASIASMRAHNLTAVARDASGEVRVVMAGGMVEVAAGLLFLSPNRPAPHVGTVGRLGDEYSVLMPVAPGVYYYQTR